MKFQKMMQAAGFAHLLGLPKAAKAEGDDNDKKKQRDDESDEDYAKRMEDDDEKKDAKSKADDGEDEEKDKKDVKSKADDGDDEEKDKKAKKAGKAEEGDDDESMQAARMVERARCAAIFASPSAGVRPDLAAHLAFNTDMSRNEAVALLDAAAAGGGRPRGLADRMAIAKIPNVGSDAGGGSGDNSAKSVAAQIIAAGAKARGEK